MLDTSITRPTDNSATRVVAICGGVGGAKLANGVYGVLGPDALSVCINTGDDFEHLGLHISPDIDTVTYTLAGLNNPKTGWGRKDETWNFMETLGSLGGDTWFSLGDRDIALHLERTTRLKQGQTLSQITQDFAKELGITANLFPMSDDPVRTRIETHEGIFDFQDYFVRLRCQPEVQRIFFEGADTAKPSADLLNALAAPDLHAVVICPSNPYLSIDPILEIPGIKRALADCLAPVIAVSPLIGGQAVKGPTSKIMSELSLPSTARAISEHYDGLIDGFVIDEIDQLQATEITVPTLVTKTLMKNSRDQQNLAIDVLEFAAHQTQDYVDDSQIIKHLKKG